MAESRGTPAFKKGDRVKISVLRALQRDDRPSQDDFAEKSLRYDGLIGRVVDLTYSGIGIGEIIYHVQIDGKCLMLDEDCLSGWEADVPDSQRSAEHRKHQAGSHGARNR